MTPKTDEPSSPRASSPLPPSRAGSNGRRTLAGLEHELEAVRQELFVVDGENSRLAKGIAGARLLLATAALILLLYAFTISSARRS